MPELLGQMIDRLITVELKNRGMPHGFLVDLYEAALSEGGGRPLTTRAAELLHDKVGKGDTVFILTGAGYPPQMPTGESDGPPGAAVLARMLYWGLGAVPVYLCEKKHEGPIKAASEAADTMIHSFENARDRGFGAALLTGPDTQEEVGDWAKAVFDRCAPRAIVCIERLGPAADGKVYNATGIVNGLTSTEMGASWLLPRLVGAAHSNDLLLTGRVIDAQEALRMGLVSRVVPAEELTDVALEAAEGIARHSAYGLAMTKSTIWANLEIASLAAAQELEDRNQLMLGFTANLPEAMAAFSEGREPVYTDEPRRDLFS